MNPSSSYNLIGDSGTAGGLTDGVNGNIVGADVTTILDTVLRDNGGPTKTHALLTTSVAIVAGGNSLAFGSGSSPLMTDQRGAGFTRIVNGKVDIGAFEGGYPTSSITGYANGSWWVSSPDANGDYTTSRWARWSVPNLLKVVKVISMEMACRILQQLLPDGAAL